MIHLNTAPQLVSVVVEPNPTQYATNRLPDDGDAPANIIQCDPHW